ncbi:hypothetical protein ACFQ0M_16295 [Kitasatospora aburaviensis]
MFAAFLAGRLDVMRDLMEEAVEGCRRHGRAVDLAFVLQIRAKTMNDWPGGLEQSLRDGEESLELYRGIGDRWGCPRRTRRTARRWRTRAGPWRRSPPTSGRSSWPRSWTRRRRCRC